MAGTKPVSADTKKLMSLARSPAGTAGRALAFAELVEAAPRNLTGFLKNIALDKETDIGLRSKAIGAIGERATPAALEVLRSSLKLKHPMLKRRAIERIGKVGTAADLKLLKSLKSDDPATRKTIRSAQVFLSYKHGLGAFRLDAQTSTLPASSATTQLATIRPASSEVAARLFKLVRVPGLKLAAQAPTELICGSHRYALFSVKGVNLQTELTHQQAIPVVVTEENIETGLYEPMYYILTDPVGRGRIRISVIRPSGRLMLSGIGTQETDAVTFALEAAVDSFHPPTSVVGRVGKDGVPMLQSVLTQTRFAKAQAKRLKRPKLQVQPIGDSS
ncbi:HEAT repeat domain-containing protein [uncultured Roseobacter sp.]|uniref:HEAT repeat domain-containing protein n=1 Tax=uncultured Roseobacter sp. TaxID=114847 RepID=UPI0026179F10|nr:HEAT repeat domain-containing protein [uncultured Roseobacter sp.]